MSDEPRVAIVTVTYNSADVLPGFLASLEAQQYRHWRLIAIDNASTDGSADRLAAWNDPRLLLKRSAYNRGFAAATNWGLRWALGNRVPWVLILNNDTSFDPDFLSRLMARAERGDAQVIAPRVVHQDWPALSWYAGGHFSSAWGFRANHEGVGRPADGTPERWVEFAPGCCTLVATPVLADGLYDERFFVYWEDADLCWRWRQAGLRILYVRDPAIRHKAGALTGGPRSPFAIRMYHRNQILFLDKHFPPASARLRAGMALAKIMARAALRQDSPAETKLRLAAMREGWRLSAEQHG